MYIFIIIIYDVFKKLRTECFEEGMSDEESSDTTMPDSKIDIGIIDDKKLAKKVAKTAKKAAKGKSCKTSDDVIDMLKTAKVVRCDSKE